MDKARQLRDVWQSRVSQAGNALDIDVVNGLNNMTLDVIGLAGACCCHGLSGSGSPLPCYVDSGVTHMPRRFPFCPHIACHVLDADTFVHR